MKPYLHDNFKSFLNWLSILDSNHQLKTIQQTLLQRIVLIYQYIYVHIVLLLLYLPLGRRYQICLTIGRFKFIPYNLFADRFPDDGDSCSWLVLISIERKDVLWKDSEVLLTLVHYSELIILYLHSGHNHRLSSLLFLLLQTINNELLWYFPLSNAWRIRSSLFGKIIAYK